MGKTYKQIQAVTGHESLTALRRYIEQADVKVQQENLHDLEVWRNGDGAMKATISLTRLVEV